MSQNIRATPDSWGRQGRTANVVGSGWAIMSDSSMALKPVIEEPSKPLPPSKASASSSALIEKLFSWPRTSVNQSRMKRMPWSSTRARTSSALCGGSATKAGRLPGSRSGVPPPLVGGALVVAQPAARPALHGLERRLEVAPHLRQGVLDADGRAGMHRALDDPPGFELLQALGEEAVGELGHGGGELAEAHGPVVEDAEDGAGPAAAAELDALVVVGTAAVHDFNVRLRSVSIAPVGVPAPLSSPRASER